MAAELGAVAGRSSEPSLARRVLAADAIFEFVLAALLMTEPVALGRLVDLPVPTWAIVAAGAALVPVGGLLALLSRLASPPTGSLRLVAGLNVATALGFTLWLVLDRSGFDAPATAFVAAVNACLCVLAAGQLASTRAGRR
jgi:hypothetical protein